MSTYHESLAYEESLSYYVKKELGIHMDISDVVYKSPVAAVSSK